MTNKKFNSLFQRKKKKSLMYKLKEFDNNHKVPNWISAIVVTITVYGVYKFIMYIIENR